MGPTKSTQAQREISWLGLKVLTHLIKWVGLGLTYIVLRSVWICNLKKCDLKMCNFKKLFLKTQLNVWQNHSLTFKSQVRL
jgi:hypothetical protein